jgi:hypothetical protein
MTYTLSGLVPSTIYKIATVAVNNEGVSPQSDYVLIGATELPEPTALITKT